MIPYRLAALALLLFSTACGREAESRVPVLDTQVVLAPTVGLDSALLQRALGRADSLPRLYSLLVYRHGRVEAEKYYHGRGPDTRANIKSASKSIISALVGIAIDDGLVEGVDQPIASFFPDYIDPRADSARARITVGNLLSMQAGLQPTSFGNYGEWVTSRNWVRSALERPMVEPPGGRMLYSTGSTHILSAILTRATQRSTLAYAREKLARPLGIDLVPWATDPQGIYFGGNEMRLTPRELLRFGELYLQGGEIDGRRILPREWIETSWQPRTRSRFNSHRYGYGWWIREAAGHPVYFAWGYGGQYLFLVPDLQLIVVTTSMADEAPRDGDHNRAIHALLENYLVPAAERGRGN